MTHILKTSFSQNPNIGMFGYSNNDITIIGAPISEKKLQEIKKTLKTEIIQTYICGTSLAGIFIAGNNNSIILPDIVLESELKELKDINHTIIKTKYTALGNLIVANDNKALISPLLEKQKQTIKKALKLKEIQTYQIKEIETLGTLIVLTDKGILLSEIAEEKDRLFLEKFFNLPCKIGTVNMGGPYVRTGIIANDKGFILGDATGGAEAVDIDIALGFLEN